MPNNLDSNANSNRSLNSYYSNSSKLSTVEKRILAVLGESAVELGPVEILAKINENKDSKQVKPGTLRPVLRSMTKRGIIIQPHSGKYCDKITYDVRIRPIAVHNLRLHFSSDRVFEHREIDESIGGVEFHVCFGVQNKEVSGWIKYDRGLDKAGCFLAVDRWIEIAEKNLGSKVEGLTLTRLEANRDEAGYSFDGSLHCETRQVLKDWLYERIYEKAEGLRHEYIVQREYKVDDFKRDFFTQSVDSALTSTSAYDTERKLEGIETVQKSINRKLLDYGESLQAIQKKMISGATSEDNVSQLIAELKLVNSEQLVFMQKQQQETKTALSELQGKSLEVEQLKQLALGQVEIFNLLVKKYTDLADLVTRFLTALGQKPPEQSNPEPSSDSRPLPSAHFYE